MSATASKDFTPDYTTLRQHMVKKQLEARGIHHTEVLRAMSVVPRHRFVPFPLRHNAYDDRPLEIGYGQTISQPYMVAIMTQLLEPQPSDRILEVGTGSGYQAAVLAQIAKEVYTIERIPELAEASANLLHELGYDNVRVFCGDGTQGLPEYAPFDGIIVTAGAPRVPRALQDQLADGGRLVCPVGPRELQHLVRVIREGNTFRQEESIGCLFVPLLGADGWHDSLS